MKKRLLKKWWFKLCSHYCFCVDQLDIDCHIACKMFFVSKRQKKIYYRYRKNLKRWKQRNKNNN